jgi:hypothetical protein
MESRIQIVAIAGAAVLLVIILDLVRRRRLLERYALVWLFSGIALLGVSLWRGALRTIAEALGIAYAPNALFFVALVFILLLLLNFSLAVSRLTDQAKVLAQRLAILEERITSREQAEQPGAEPEAEPQYAERALDR